ncbi:MAG: hypothetical protein EWM47_02605 [Anaerolineaceae bacterium]|nr:MAG: hypothetical protein EWM47_02605 [Anaerolineaceae bacterium]
MEKRKRVLGIVEWLLVLVLMALLSVIALKTKDRLGEVKEMVSMQDSKLVLYEGPKSLKDASPEDLKAAKEKDREFSLLHCVDTIVKINGYDCYVYDTNVNHSRSWSPDYMPVQSRTPVTYFDFEGIANIEVTVPDISLTSVKLSPVSSGIEPLMDAANNKVSFTITEPGNYTLTFNDSPSRALHIFANPLETDIPSMDDENVIYIGPGEWNIESIMMEDNQTLYIAGGAVIHGVVNANYAENVKVLGRGIIDGSQYKTWGGSTAHIPLKFDFCDGVELRDIIVLNPNAWVLNSLSTKNELIDGVRIISSRPNGDGITLQSCENITVQNCFVRSWDDSLVVKNYQGNSNNITFKNNQLWTDLAQSMEIGFETNKGKEENAMISNITFEDITVLNNFHKPVISVHNADDAMVKDIVFRNIIVENAQMGSGDGDEMPYLIDLLITQSSNWSKTKERGQIRNVLIDGVKVLSGRFNGSRIEGYNADHTVEDVTIKNVEILGEKIISFEQGKFEIASESTKNLVIE